MAKVLVTDDASFMRSMMKNVLQEGGHEVIGEAANGQEAVEKYAEQQPDVVTMDITMPVMNGIQAVKSIINKHPDAKILMCSAMGQTEMVLDAINSGAKGFVVKPFDKTKILEEISKLSS